MWNRDDHPFGDAASVGVGLAFLLSLIDFVSLSVFDPGLPLSIEAIPAVVQTLQAFLVGGLNFLVFDQGHRYLLLLLIPLLFLVWRQSRHVTVRILTMVLTPLVAWVFGVVQIIAYSYHHGLGLLPVPIAALIAVLLARWQRLRIGSMVILAAGLSIAMVEPLVSGDDRNFIVEPLPRFTSIAAVFLLVSWLTSRFSDAPSATPVRRFVGLWGLTAVCLGSLFFTAGTAIDLSAPEKSSNRHMDDWAYDLLIIGEPSQIVWTDKTRIQVLTDVYGSAHERYELDMATSDYPQRIWPSPVDGFYVQTRGQLGWWRTPEDGERISARPAHVYHPPMPDFGDEPAPYALGEDPVRRQLITISEWYSEYAVIDRDSGALTVKGRLSNTIWPYWQVTPDPSRRVFYLTSCMEDGGLYELNLDSLGITKRISNLFLYRMAPDPEGGLFWGVRPLTGELLGLDIESFEVRYRIHLGFGIMDVQRDPRTGDLYTCSFLDGEIFRVNPRTREYSTIGRCGRLCRNLLIDSRTDMLWVATRDGICRFPLLAKGTSIDSGSASADPSAHHTRQDP